MAKKRLLWQLFPYFLLVSFLSIAAAAWYAAAALHRFHLQQTASDLEARVRLVQGEVAGLLGSRDHDSLDRVCKELGRESGTRFTVILPSGAVIADSDEPVARMENHANRPEIRQAIAGQVARATRYSATLKRNMMYVAVPVLADGAVQGVVRASLPLYAIEKPFQTLRLELIAGVLLLVFLAGAAGYVVSRRLSQPIEEMKRAAERYALGNLSHRVPVPESAELGSLAEVLNRLAADLGEKIALLERQHHEQTTIFASMVEGVVAVDEGERIMTLNAAAARLLGVRLEDAVGHSLQEAVRNADLQKLVGEAFRTGGPVEGDVVLYSDRDIYAQAHVTTLRSSLGRSTGALIVLNDVTRLRKLENLRRDFVANVSHELRTPITSIKGFVETLQDGAIDHPEDARRFLEIIARHADRLNAIIEDLLNLSRVEQQSETSQVELASAPIKTVVSAAVQVCQVQAQAKGVPIDVRCAEGLSAPVNAPLLEQAVINLIDNAVKYSPAGKPVRVEATRSGDDVVIAVCDSGCGIDAEHLPRLFERFYRVDKARSRQLGGTGLGLAIVKHIALAHGGSVGVESTVGQGSVFTIRIPADRSNDSVWAVS